MEKVQRLNYKKTYTIKIMKKYCFTCHIDQIRYDPCNPDITVEAGSLEEARVRAEEEFVKILVDLSSDQWSFQGPLGGEADWVF